MYKVIISFLCLTIVACSQTLTENKKDVFTTNGKTVVLYTTAKDTTLRLWKCGEYNFEKAGQPLEKEVAVFVNPKHTFQEFLGIGGAITDASAEVYAKLTEAKQNELLAAYYGESGNNYSLIRTSIHSCDFSSSSYTYVDEGDAELNSFSIERDKQFRLPLIKKALEKAGGKILLYASPWSPPAFMKSNKNMLKGGKLLPEFYQSWANYYIKFIKAYESEGLPIWGVTIQNEPMAVQTWESCIYTAEEERDFLKNYLGPTFANEGLSDKKIVVWDHNRDLINHRASAIFDDPEAAKYAWGTGFHWYEAWIGGSPKYDNVAKVKEAYPEKGLLFTEGCSDSFDSTRYQHWANAEKYGQSMINDFNAGTAGWTDWNILLDEQGGPNHVENFCFAPVHADTRTSELIYTPSYFYIGHFSRFIRPGATRVSTSPSRSSLLSTSFLNTNGKMVTVVMNETENAIDYKLYVDTMAVALKIPAHAIQTLVY